ncbi:imm11 family protein [Gilliamella intestini]|uniref:Immunity MXAN-0049 protein domain-containing protein n=1 Tax=Gilliamella intestini TaxID=1798183 RepID=A0A1C4AY01_9GAMM|nr:DUF1629 domain-containing protein [Gilliamella intestini]SCB99436.1 hypothetical protein GA0061080_10158 [Gilliamella intestini]
MNEFEYYIIDRAGDKAYPLIGPQDDSFHTMMYPRTTTRIENPEMTNFKYCEPIPRKPVISDYFSEPESIVSKKIAEVLAPLDIKGIQLIPAEIETHTGDILEDYFYIHIYNYLKAVDREKSKCEADLYDPDSLAWIDRFELDRKVLEKIPLEERLVFKLIEFTTIHLYHKSVVDAIMAVNPQGVLFTKVEDWYF